jgi:ribosomal subunit interface protein
MKLPLEVTFRNLGHSDAIEASIRDHAERLERFSSDIMACRVVVEADHRHHHKGNLYHVRVDLTVPGTELVASRRPAEHQEHQDVYVAVRDAFDAARRQLEDFVRRRRGEVKHHPPPAHGRVLEVFPDAGYGTIETADGRVVYFHANSVLGVGLGDLPVGSEVRFDEETGERGPQASTVHPVGKHHPVG